MVMFIVSVNIISTSLFWSSFGLHGSTAAKQKVCSLSHFTSHIVIVNLRKFVARKSLKTLMNFHGLWTLVLCLSTFTESARQIYVHLTIRSGDLTFTWLSNIFLGIRSIF